MHKLASYTDVRKRIQPGDIIAFGGNSLFSRWTKLTTGANVTHVALVLETPRVGINHHFCRHRIIEATRYKRRFGVMLNNLHERITTYPGDVWWLPLNTLARQRLDHNHHKFTRYMMAQEHGKYDIWQLFGAAVDISERYPRLRRFAHNKEDLSSWFCSELVSAGLREAEVLGHLNASEVTPIDVCRFNIFDKHYIQLKGKIKKIKDFNSLDPTGWGLHN